MPINPERLRRAGNAFDWARQRAAMEEVFARLSGRPNELLSYEEIARKLGLKGRADAGIRAIRVRSIVGSVSRYNDFTRSFLPRHGGNRERWARVQAAFTDPNESLPPIEVYKVGDVYFVLDGNHRVSVARREGMEFIDAHVIEIRTPVSLSPGVQPDDLIIKAEHAQFLETTQLADARPNVDVAVTSPGQHGKMLMQIGLHQAALQQQDRPDISLQEAAADWYDQVYIPLAETIRDRGLLRWFPGRTLTDLFMWISENRAALEQEAGWKMRSEAAASDLIIKKGLRNRSGSWRGARLVNRYVDSLFQDILVPISGDAESWDALEQAILIAGREGARIHGLHIVGDPVKAEDPAALAMSEQFARRCSEAGIEGKLVIESGDVMNKIRERAPMADLIVLKIQHPPRAGFASLKSPFRALLANSSCPVLAVPEGPSRFQRALLAYDGSRRAREALFVAGYLAEIWKTELVVFTALQLGKIKAGTQDYARRYLEIHEIEATYMIAEEDLMQSLRQAAEEYGADLVLSGSYGGPRLRALVNSSSLNFLLQESKIPIFICF
jgi:nucleotide-binding universal stress UspA family protein